MDHVTFSLKNNMPMAAVFLDIEEAFSLTWHLGLLYKLPEFKFLTWLIKLINSFLSRRKLRSSVKGEMSTPRCTQAGVPQGSILSSTLYSIYINDRTQRPGVYLCLFADDTCILIYATDSKESCTEFSVVLRRGVRAGT
jgi:hypothetical protein